MGIRALTGRTRRVTLVEAGIEEAFHRCIDLASPFGSIELMRPSANETREFVLDVGDKRSRRLQWTFRAVLEGTELSIVRPSSMAWLSRLTRASLERDLEARLAALPHLLNLRIVVLGGGTGLYTTLRALRDRTSSLGGVVVGQSRSIARDPKDELGWLPNDDASMGLVAMAPTVRSNLVLRSLMGHRMCSGALRGTDFGTLLLEGLTEVCGGRQAALDEAVRLLGIRGRVILVEDSDGSRMASSPALETVTSADLVVVAPGHLDDDVLPVLGCTGMREALHESRALKVVVTNTMSAEGYPIELSTSQLADRLATAAAYPFDVLLANSATFSEQQLRTYAAKGANPIIPDVERTALHARVVLTRHLAAPGDLARHDPELLGNSLLEIASAWLYGSLQTDKSCYAEEIHMRTDRQPPLRPVLLTERSEPRWSKIP